MGGFFKTFFASLLALVVFTVIAVFVFAGVVGVIVGGLGSSKKEETGSKAVLVLDLNHAFREQMQGNPLAGSIVTWLIYLIIIQSRINAGWGGRAAALASIVSFIIVICSLVGVQYLGHAF